VGDLRKLELSVLDGRFGRYGARLYELSRGVDQSEVVEIPFARSPSSKISLNFG
jgi:nucleotidyltransferase/DNA polymerase involved in DNA repair